MNFSHVRMVLVIFCTANWFSCVWTCYLAPRCRRIRKYAGWQYSLVNDRAPEPVYARLHIYLKLSESAFILHYLQPLCCTIQDYHRITHYRPTRNDNHKAKLETLHTEANEEMLKPL